MSSLVHAENTTFRTDSPQGRFCLRISRPGYQSTANIRSELAFLSALRAEEFRVPEPWQGRLVTAVTNEVPEPRDCVLFRWMGGDFRRRPAQMSVEDARLVGQTMGRLHAFSTRWTPPEGFDRQPSHALILDPRRPMPIDAPNPMLSEENRALLLEVDAATRALFARLPKDEANYGIIHADLHVGNLLFEDDKLNVIDFDDTGWGFWMYEFAASLAYETIREDGAAIREAMFEGYASERPLPPRATELIGPFIQHRFASISNWVLERSDNPMLREQGPSWITHFCEGILAARKIGGQ